ncbi:MAG: hypothetical protein H6681_02030 [Desulfobacteraceae bacterium]|nr:hypothetical protein [Desulfobacteraceae bacterium]MCB9494206.1 hypothetical protein [Desulfobacteraceae bacterium]
MKKEEKTKGIASLFDQIEIKSFLKNYLIFIGIVEAVIFFVCFVEQLGSKDIPFPWKNYFFAAFIIPVVITFLLGILVAGFNKYLYGFSSHEDSLLSDQQNNDDNRQGYLRKIEAVLVLFQKLPFLLTLFILTLAAGIIYKLDAIVGFISAAGQKSLEYLMIIAGTGIGIAAIFTLIWLILNYKLQKKSIEYKHAYRETVIKQLGMVILDDDTVVDKNGNIINKDNKEKSRNTFYPAFPKGNGSLKPEKFIEAPQDKKDSEAE